MKSIVKNIKSTDIKQYSKEEFYTAFLELQSKNTKSKELSSKVRILILAIIELSEELKLDYKSTNIKKQLLHTLSKSDNLNYVGIGEIVSEILEGKKMICIDNKSCQDTFETVEYSNEVNFVWDIEKGWKVMKVSNNIQNILGYNPKDFKNGNLNFSEIIHPDDITRISKEVEEHSNNKDSDFIQEYRITKKDGETIIVKDRTIVKFDEKGEIKYFYGYIYDITEQKEMEEYIKQHAFFDTKTGLPNEIQLQKDIENIEGHKMIIKIKVNDFNDINTTYGFSEGDKIILIIANKLKIEFEKMGFKVYKTSQLNFGLLKGCTEISPNEKVIKGVREKTIKGIQNIIDNFLINTFYGKMYIKLSTGISCGKEATFDNALHALYRAHGKSDLVIFDKDLEKGIKLESENRIKWSKMIKEGLEKGYFLPYYQQIRNNNSGKIEKCEALIRYNNGKNIYSPFHFLDIAENIGLLQDLSKRMINKVIEEMNQHDLDISINLTEKDFLDDNIILLIKNKLIEYNIKPSRLTIEVLEDITDEENNSIVDNIRILKEIGTKISIDDFGTGNSNFARLLDISPEYLKIDGSLVRGIVGKNSHKYLNILRSIIDFGHKQGAQIIAEYVENKEIQDKIEILGVDYSQGYYYSKPSRELIEKNS